MKFLIISLFSILYSAEVTSIYKIDGMMCAVNCPKIVYDSIININGIHSCQVDFDNETVKKRETNVLNFTLKTKLKTKDSGVLMANYERLGSYGLLNRVKLLKNKVCIL